jgi:hypothetical protein
MLEMARKLVAHQRELLIEGKPETLAGTFDFPLAVQMDEDMLVFSDPQDLLAGVKLYRAEMTRLGVATMTTRITAIELPRDGRFRIWADWDIIRDGQIEVGAKRSIYYCRTCLKTGVPVTKIEMLQCTRYRTQRDIAPLRRRALG